MLDDRLQRQLAELGLDGTAPPTPEQWQLLLRALSRLLAADHPFHPFHTPSESLPAVEAAPRKPSRRRRASRPPDTLDWAAPDFVLQSLAAAFDRPPDTLETPLPAEDTLDESVDINLQARLHPLAQAAARLPRRRNASLLSRLEARAKLFVHMFLNSNDAVLLYDEQGRILEGNPRAQVMFGYEPAELREMTLANLRPPDLRANELDIRHMTALQSARFETRLRRRDDTVFSAEVSSSVFEFDSIRVHHGLIRDVSERKRSEQSLRNAKEEAETAYRAKTEFLSNMSHELRTPLNAILGFGRVLARGAYGDLNDRQLQYLEDIIHSGEHMLQLVNNLLDLRRLEERTDVLTLVAAPLQPLIEEAVSMIRPLVGERNHRIELNFSGRLPDAWADQRAVVRVLVNLLSNSVKYTPIGGQIEIRCYVVNDQLRVDVIDNGVGIAPDDHQRVFTSFERIQTGVGTVAVHGSGLGLALSRQLIRRMDGDIGVESALDQGSTFFFTLPIASDSEGNGKVKNGERERENA